MHDAFEAALDAALRVALPGVFRAAAVTTLVADAADPDRLARALERLLAVLPRAGVPRGRVSIVLAADATGAPPGRAVAGALRAALGIPVIAHDPRSSACFTAGRVAGGAVELCDELREAEAVLALGPLEPGAEARALHALVVPGLASEATREALGAHPDALAAARALVPVDLAVGWRAGAGGGWWIGHA